MIENQVVKFFRKIETFVRSLIFIATLFFFGISFAAGNNKVFEKSLDGLNRVEAVIELEKLGLAYDIRRVPDCGIPDTVVGTIPIIKAETSVPSNEVITLKITTKSGLATVPKVLGMTLAAATIELEKNCFQVTAKIHERTYSGRGACGEVYEYFKSDGGVENRIIRVHPRERSQATWTSKVIIERQTSGEIISEPTGKICK